eukprot:1916645-Pyramimonas_sp.AAC.1
MALDESSACCLELSVLFLFHDCAPKRANARTIIMKEKNGGSNKRRSYQSHHIWREREMEERTFKSSMMNFDLTAR